ncbi:MAG: RHS repeat-associated core domain-containing protein, partial [Acidobacteriota bacterium]|nr:RHS repeat-associated core domain-containing protein [Acidobacteriota bacterium]
NNWISIETTAECGTTGYSNALSLRRGGGGGGCLKQATMFLYALRTGFGDDGSSSQEIGTSNDGSDCPLGTLFNAYYQPAGSSTVVLLYAQPQGIPRIQLPDQPAGAGHGQYWFTAVDPVTLVEFDQSAPITDDVRNTTQNQSPASAPGSRNLQFVHRDHLGSTRLMTDENGVEIGRWRYFPFGMEATTEESGDQRMKFTGHERDGEVELDYMLARYYGSSLGRFLSVDPSLESADSSFPQSWSRSSYSLDNPVRFVDPDGRKYANAAGRRLKNRIINQSDPSPTGTATVRALDAEPERVKVKISGKAMIELVDNSGKAVPGTQRVVAPKNVGKAVANLQSQAKAGQRVAPVAGTYTPKKTDAQGNVTKSQVTIYLGSQNISKEWKGKSQKEFVNATFVHESAHGVGPGPAPEPQAKQTENDYKKESQDGKP